MVSLIRKFSCVFFMSALVLVCLLIPTELKAAPCCINGKLSTCADGVTYDLSGCENLGKPGLEKDNRVDLEPSEGEEVLEGCTSGQVQYKPSGDCGTSSRTCCLDGTWSDWDGECPNCGDRECWINSKCQPEPPAPCSCTNGRCQRTWTCTPGTGWSYTDSTCVCNSGYTLKNGKCEKNTLSCVTTKSESDYYATCAKCWTAAKALTDRLPKCTSDSSINCYIMHNSLGYESVSSYCDSEQHSITISSGGSTSILTMRYNHGLPSGSINCYFEGLEYRTCTD